MSGLRARYPGAQPFADDEVSRKIFFGREQTARVLTDLILANRMVVVFGKSGLGKSSLLNAGICQRLRDEDRLPLIVRVNDTQRGPFVSVLEGIRVAAERQKVEYVPGKPDSLWSFFKTVEFWRGDRLLTPVLILDQFEELFTLQGRDARTAFIADLGYVVRGIRPPLSTNVADAKLSDRPPAIGIVLSLREDYLGLLDDAADRIPQILDHRFRLTPLSVDAAAEAMTGPARIDDPSFQTKPFRYDPETITAILSYLSKRRTKSVAEKAAYIEPFHLQLICQRIEAIAAKQQADLPITMNSVGGESALKQTLEEFYTQTLSTFPNKRDRRAVRRLCEEFLISPEGRRLSVEQHQICRQLKLPVETLQQLVNDRLLRSDSRSDSTYYELSHDALVEPVFLTSRMRALFFAWLGVVTGSVAAFVLGGFGFVSLLYFIYDSTGKIDLSVLVFRMFIVGAFIVLGVMCIVIVLRNVRAIQRFRWRTLDEPAEPQQIIGRQRDWTLGWLVIGAGSIGLLWVSVLVTAFVLNLFFGGKEPEDLELAFLDFASAPLFVLLGVMAIRWGLDAVDWMPIRHKVQYARPLLRLAAASIAVFAATLWGGGLLYLLAAISSTKGIPPTWVPSRYHNIWKDVFERGVLGAGKFSVLDAFCQIVGVAGLLFLGLLLLFQGIRAIRDRQRSQIARNDVRVVGRV